MCQIHVRIDTIILSTTKASDSARRKNCQNLYKFPLQYALFWKPPKLIRNLTAPCDTLIFLNSAETRSSSINGFFQILGGVIQAISKDKTGVGGGSVADKSSVL